MHDSLGSAFVNSGRLDEGVASIRRAIAIEPDFAGFHYNLAIALGKQKKEEESVASYRRAIELDPTDARYHMNLGNALLSVGDPDEALASFGRAASLWSGQHDAYAVEWHAKALNAIAKLQPYFDQRNRLLATLRGERESKDAEELCAAADLGYARGECQLAIHAFELAIAIDPKVARYHMNLGVAFEQLGRLDDAIASYDRAIELDPKEAPLHLNLGNALQKKGELDDAIGCYRESVELDPKYVKGWVVLCRALSQNGEWEESIACARKAVELEPQSTQRVELAAALFSAGRVDEAIACVRKAIDADPNAANVANAHHSLGAILVKSNRLKEALPSYRKAVELAPDRAAYHLDLALVLDDLGQHDAALVSFQRAVELDPRNAMAHYKLGWCLQEKHRYDEAIESYRATIEIDPDHAEAHCNLASCLQDTGHFAEALQYFRRGHELGSKRKDWSYPSAEWVRAAEMRVALEAKLPALLAGKVEPKDNAERFEYAIMAQIKEFNHASARLFADAFAADPKLADEPGHLYDSAFSPVRAAAGRGEDASKLDDHERARLRKQALDWLRADLTQYARKLATGNPEERAAVLDALRKWQEEPELTSIRDSAALALLPAEEKDAFGRLWADVADLLRSK